MNGRAGETEMLSSTPDDDPGFAAWCERMCLSRLRRRLAAGLPISAIGRRTLARFGVPLRSANNGTAPVLELVNEIVDPPIDLASMHETLTTLLVGYARRQAQPT